MASDDFNGHHEHLFIEFILTLDILIILDHIHQKECLQCPHEFPVSQGLRGHSGPLGCRRKVMGAAYVQDALALHSLEEPRRSAWRCHISIVELRSNHWNHV